MRTFAHRLGRGRPLFSSSRIDDADFGAPPGKSETTDASESKRDVHQRSVRDDHETTESFGTCVFFLLCVCVCLFDERQERARALATDSFLSFYSSFELVASTLTRTCSPLGFTSSCGTFKRCRYAIQSKDCVFTRRLSRRRATFGEDPIEAIEAKTRRRQVARERKRRRK